MQFKCVFHNRTCSYGDATTFKIAVTLVRMAVVNVHLKCSERERDPCSEAFGSTEAIDVDFVVDVGGMLCTLFAM